MPNQQDNTMTERNDRISKRGFASMDRTRQREIARLGGRAAHQRGTAHEFTRDEAREAGRKGGVAVSQDREHMARIGRRGGERRSARLSSLRTGPASTGASTTEDTVEMPTPGSDRQGDERSSGNSGT